MTKKNRGMTLTELAIVLGAMGLVMGGVWAVVGTVWDGYRFQKMNQQIQAVARSLQDYYGNIGGVYQPSGHTAYSNDTDITAVVDDDDRRLIPTEMRLNKNAEGAGLRHAMGGAVTVESVNNGGGFRLNIEGLNEDACIKLVMQFPVLMPELGVTRMESGGGNTDIDLSNVVSPSPTGVSLPLSLQDATTWCNTPTNNEVRFEFRVRS
ncbi:MAG: type II secretion system protein [Bdellovibrionales bacterium]|jgi:type II secretory pathway pseudopilin PulG